MRTAARHDEVALAQGVAQKEEAALTALYRSYAGPVFRFVNSRLAQQREDAEEILQETFLSAVSLAPTYDGTSSLLTWLCGIAKLRIVDFYRRRGRERQIPSEKLLVLDDDTVRLLLEFESGACSMDTVLDHLEAESVVRCMMAPLSEDERSALILRFVEELPVRDIAGLIGRTEKATEHLIVRARKKAAAAAAEWI